MIGGCGFRFVQKQTRIPPLSVCCHLYVVGVGIAYLSDPDRYAGWSVILLLGPPKPERLKDRGQTK